MHKGSQGEWGFSHHYRAIRLPLGLTDAGMDLAIIDVLPPLRYPQDTGTAYIGNTKLSRGRVTSQA